LVITVYQLSVGAKLLTVRLLLENERHWGLARLSDAEGLAQKAGTKDEGHDRDDRALVSLGTLMA